MSLKVSFKNNRLFLNIIEKIEINKILLILIKKFI